MPAAAVSVLEASFQKILTLPQRLDFFFEIVDLPFVWRSLGGCLYSPEPIHPFGEHFFALLKSPFC